jgi:hypothetical protein
LVNPNHHALTVDVLYLQPALTDQSVIIDNDTAVIVGTDTARGIENGAPYTIVARYTVTYIRRHRQWVALAEHLVKVPEAK